MIRSVRLWLQGFMQDRQGLAAIEFALLAPIMLLLYFGMTEFSTAYLASRRANHTASIIADLIAQSESTSPTELDLALQIGDLIVAPFDSATLSVRITSITMDDNGVPKVDWSRASGTGLPALPKTDTYIDLPDNLITTGQTLIVGESHYVYNSGVTQVLKAPMTFKRRYFLRPRALDKIACKNC